jgi:CheY-like chemotaxis protein
MMEPEFHSFYLADDLIQSLPGSGKSQEASREPQRSRPRVLVVDDQKLIVDTIAEILEGAGFEVAVACDAWTALELAASFQPDRLLSDVLMPGMNGVELAIAVRKMYPAVKILLFTGQTGISEILENAEERGYKFEVLPKPIHPRKLVEHLKNQE